MRDVEVESYTIRGHSVRVVRGADGYRVVQSADGEIVYISDAYQGYGDASYIYGIRIGKIEELS